MPEKLVEYETVPSLHSAISEGDTGVRPASQPQEPTVWCAQEPAAFVVTGAAGRVVRAGAVVLAGAVVRAGAAVRVAGGAVVGGGGAVDGEAGAGEGDASAEDSAGAGAEGVGVGLAAAAVVAVRAGAAPVVGAAFGSQAAVRRARVSRAAAGSSRRPDLGVVTAGQPRARKE